MEENHPIWQKVMELILNQEIGIKIGSRVPNKRRA